MCGSIALVVECPRDLHDRRGVLLDERMMSDAPEADAAYPTKPPYEELSTRGEGSVACTVNDKNRTLDPGKLFAEVGFEGGAFETCGVVVRGQDLSLRNLGARRRAAFLHHSHDRVARERLRV